MGRAKTRPIFFHGFNVSDRCQYGIHTNDTTNYPLHGNEFLARLVNDGSVPSGDVAGNCGGGVELFMAKGGVMIALIIALCFYAVNPSLGIIMAVSLPAIISMSTNGEYGEVIVACVIAIGFHFMRSSISGMEEGKL